MIINKLNPQGYCQGVKRALKLVIEAINNEQTPKPIYLLGSIIHNKYVNQKIVDLGAQIIDIKGKTRYELLDYIDSGTVVISAHGASKRVHEKAKQKGLNVIDSTCGNVKIIHKKIETHLNNGYTCLYIGSKGHPECEAILEMNESIILLENINDAEKIKLTSDKIYVTNQTTLSIIDTKEIYDLLINKYPNIIAYNKICDATTKRQLAVLNQDKPDLCIIIGDPNSSNTKKLALISRQANINTLLIENVNDIKNYNFTNINSVSITSGASTPDILVDEVIKYLEEIS